MLNKVEFNCILSRRTTHIDVKFQKIIKIFALFERILLEKVHTYKNASHILVKKKNKKKKNVSDMLIKLVTTYA
jgi:hypothetical protein